MTRIDDDTHPGGNAGSNAIVVHEVIVRVQNVRPVAPQLLRNIPDGADVRPGALSKCAHRDILAGRFFGETAGMRQTINQRLVTIRKLALRKVDSQSFKAADI
jgi:hypothetical protein